MRLPVFQFRDRLGETLNLSSVKDRTEIRTAELYHEIDVHEGLWCRPCQSSNCPHTLQIAHVLGTAGLGDG